MAYLRRELRGDLESPASLTVVQWNALADWLAHDNFLHAPAACLSWPDRGERILALFADGLPEPPDLICLQEVDHHAFFAARLGERGYADAFAAKEEGRDGCSLFVRRDRYGLEDVKSFRYHDPDGTPHTQLALMARLVPVNGGPSLHVTTTHLKAKQGHEEKRCQQARQLLEALPSDLPLIVAGDFNDEPGSPAHEVMRARLVSAYAELGGCEPRWTTWKVRAGGEKKRTIDYLWYSPERLRPLAILEIPEDEQVEEARLPSWQYPSDHLSLAARFALT